MGKRHDGQRTLGVKPRSRDKFPSQCGNFVGRKRTVTKREQESVERI